MWLGTYLPHRAVVQDRPADAEHHRAMPLDQGRKGVLGRLVLACRKPFQQLPIRQAPDGADLEQRLNVPGASPRFPAISSSPGSSVSPVPRSNVTAWARKSHFLG